MKKKSSSRKLGRKLGVARWLAKPQSVEANDYIFRNLPRAEPIESVKTAEEGEERMWEVGSKAVLSLLIRESRKLRMDILPYFQKSPDEPAKLLSDRELGLEEEV
jgi:hypothetical protein